MNEIFDPITQYLYMKMNIKITEMESPYDPDNPFKDTRYFTFESNIDCTLE